MKKIDYEQISSLMDDEDYDLEHTLDEFLQDEESARVWYEYHLIRDCLRHQESKLGFDISTDIKEKIRQEPQYHIKKKTFRVANMPIKAFASVASVACVLVIASVAWNIKSATSIETQSMAVSQEPVLIEPTLAGNYFEQLLAESQQEAIEISATPSYAKYEYVQNQDQSNLEDPYLRAHFEAVTHDGLMRAVAVGE